MNERLNWAIVIIILFGNLSKIFILLPSVVAVGVFGTDRKDFFNRTKNGNLLHFYNMHNCNTIEKYITPTIFIFKFFVFGALKNFALFFLLRFLDRKLMLKGKIAHWFKIMGFTCCIFIGIIVYNLRMAVLNFLCVFDLRSL